ncbi:MAG TPA: hypothetical protein VED17_05505 [Nitrososphaerales archaeon]|nr:hypothetical protein [Nitrososphaerales archaeon]
MLSKISATAATSPQRVLKINLIANGTAHPIFLVLSEYDTMFRAYFLSYS